MAEWAGPQWVLATLFAVATLINLTGTLINKKSATENIGWLGSQVGTRAVVVAILIWGGFF